MSWLFTLITDRWPHLFATSIGCQWINSQLSSTGLGLTCITPLCKRFHLHAGEVYSRRYLNGNGNAQETCCDYVTATVNYNSLSDSANSMDTIQCDQGPIHATKALSTRPRPYPCDWGPIPTTGALSM